MLHDNGDGILYRAVSHNQKEIRDCDVIVASLKSKTWDSKKKYFYLFLLLGTRPGTSFVGILRISHNPSDQSFILVDSNCWISLIGSSVAELLPCCQILKPWVWENMSTVC